MPNGYYLTIGLNNVSSFYTATPLAGCINDARDVARIAEGKGFKKPRDFKDQPLAMLTDADATRDRVLEAIKAAASQMEEGDAFLLHYSGHGLENGTVDESGDVDTCWATYDKPLVDNELYAAWFAFPKRSRILVISDSCHSGTVIRSVNKRNLGGGENQRATIKKHPKEFANLKKRAAEIKASTEGKKPSAGVLLLSGCKDSEFSNDGDGNGLFTENLKAVWAGGAFEGDYRKFHEEIARRVALVDPTQNPQRMQVGSSTVSQAFLRQKPFEV